MRWDEIIDPRLRAYRRSTLRPGGPVSSKWAPYALTPDEVREMYDRDKLFVGSSLLPELEVDWKVPPENLKAIAAAFDVPETILGSERGVRSTP